MDMSSILEVLLPSLKEPPDGFKKLDETTCNTLCQHPGCWASVRRQQKGITRSLSPLDINSDDSDSDLDLPKQSICNLLMDYGESPTDRYPLSTGGRPSHQWESNPQTVTRSTRSVDSYPKLKAPHNTKGSLHPKGSSVSKRRSRVPLVEVQEVFDKTDLNSQWDETFVTKQYYMWVPNPRKGQKKNFELPLSRETYQSMPLLMKDMTECMVPPEIEQKREDTIMFDEWPVLKKKSQRTRSPPSRPVQFKKATSVPSVPPTTDLDTEGINELLALPKDALMKVLEHTKRSDFTSKGKLRTILQEYVRYDERARMALNAHELFQPRKMQILKQRNTSSQFDQNKPPIFHLDDEMILDRMSSVNTPVKDKDSVSDIHSVKSFPRYKKPLPEIQGKTSQHEDPMNVSKSSLTVMNKKARIPSISLGLPELPSGVKTTRPFSYNKKSLVDFSLGPVISPPSTERSSLGGDCSEHGTTVKVHVSSSVFDFMANERTGDQAIHSVSPALSTHVPHAPAVTPATFMSPTKSAPVFRDYKDLSRDPTSLSLSQKAMPPSRDVRETTLLSSMPSNVSQRQTLSPMDTKLLETPDEIALDTINETARENVDAEGSVKSSQRAVADVNEIFSPRREEMAALALEPSALTSIHTGVSPVLKSARSIGSCPSPEQWPLISESSFENLMPRHSVSEPALSARNRNLTAGGLDEDIQAPIRDFARKVLDDKATVESPAPPPPSPEPKDHEPRPRKELKSRDSLSMAPLFEVNEVEEGSPIKELGDEDNETADQKGCEKRLKRVRQIHAVIPQAKVEHDKIDDNDDVMVSQITVTHVTPKGPDPNIKKGEKVQETFLNVDIPAEEISSLKAEHGSSHQEDISSNDTVIQSNSTTTGSDVSAAKAVPEAMEQKEGNSNEKNERDAQNERHLSERTDTDAFISEMEKTLQLEDDGQHREDSGKQCSEGSTISPELMCDSARFLNHELVSPVDGDLEEDGESQMLPILNESNAEEIAEKTDPPPETVVADELKQNADVNTNEMFAETSMEVQKVDQESKEIRDMEMARTISNTDDDVEPPGSFFFRASSSSSTPQDKTVESQEVQGVKMDAVIDKELKNCSQTEPGINEIEGEVGKTVTVRPEMEMTNEQDRNLNPGEEKVKTDVGKEETSSLDWSAEQSNKQDEQQHGKEEEGEKDGDEEKTLITAVAEKGMKETLENDDPDEAHLKGDYEEVTASVEMDSKATESVNFDINEENQSSVNAFKDSTVEDENAAVGEDDTGRKNQESNETLQTVTRNEEGTLITTQEVFSSSEMETNVVQSQVSLSDGTEVQHGPVQVGVEKGEVAGEKSEDADAVQPRLEPEGSNAI